MLEPFMTMNMNTPTHLQLDDS